MDGEDDDLDDVRKLDLGPSDVSGKPDEELFSPSVPEPLQFVPQPAPNMLGQQYATLAEAQAAADLANGLVPPPGYQPAQQAGFSFSPTGFGNLISDITTGEEEEDPLDLGGNSEQIQVKRRDPRNRHFDHNGAWKERKNGGIYAGGTKAFSKEEVDRCVRIFQLYDVDGSGGVDFPEFCVLFTVLKFPQSFTEDEAMGYFLKFDIDQDEMLNEDEFLRLVTRELCRKTVIRRQEMYGLLERGIDGGRRLQEEAELEAMNPFPNEEPEPEPREETVEEMLKRTPIAHTMSKAAKTSQELALIKSIIESHFLFYGLSKERFNEMAHSMGTVEVPVGQLLLEQGRPNFTMYIVKQGDLSLLRDGTPFGVCDQEIGAVFGDKGLVCGEEEVCTRSVIANKPVICYALPRDTFNKVAGVPWEARIYDTCIESIRQSTLFPVRSNFNEACIHWLAEELQPIVCEPGDHIYAQGDSEDTSLYFIRMGHCFMSGGDIPANKVVRMGESDPFGEDCQLFGCPRTTSVKCGKECKKCSGIGALGTRKFVCNRCAGSGSRTDGPLVYMYKLSAQKFGIFLELPNTETGEPGGVLNMMRQSVLARVIKTQYPNVPFRYEDISNLTEAFVTRAVEAGEEVVLEGQEWPNFCVVMSGYIKCFENNLSIGEVGPSGCVSTLENLVAPVSMTAPDFCLLSLISRNDVRRVVHPETAKYLVGPLVLQHKPYEYTTLEALSDGYWGRVSLVQHRSTQKKYAMHAIRKEVVEKFEGYELRCHAEFAVATRREIYELVDHPFVCRIEATGLDKQSLYMWTQFVPGGSLALHLEQRQGFSVTDALFYVGVVAVALECIHSKRVVHRDLQPGNLLIDANGYPKLVGFGRSRKITSKTFTICGNPAYMPPEMLKKHGYDKAVDLWQLGCLTYELLCNNTPFGAEEMDAGMPDLYNEIRDSINPAFLSIRRRILSGSVAFPWQIPIKVHHFIRSLLNPVPESRLGRGRREFRDIFDHTCFEGLDWEALREQKLKPPFRPQIHGDVDLRNFPNRPKGQEKPGKVSPWAPKMW